MAEAHSYILIVDDDAEDLASVERALRSLGSELLKVKDPHEVLPAVHRNRPDVVVLDALLPGLSGFDLCKQIKSDAQLKATQVLILTGVYLRHQYRQEALQQFKADAFLTKPFRPPELQRIVVQLLARKTRIPQSRFLKRIGLSAAGDAKKKGFFGRIFGKEDLEEGPETVRIAPLARDVGEAEPLTLPVSNVVTAKSETTGTPVEAPKPAPTPQPDGNLSEPKPMPTADRIEPAPEPPAEEPVEAAAPTEPPPAEEVAEGESEPEPPEVAAPESAPVDETAPSVPELNELSASSSEGVIWVEAEPRPANLSLDEIAAGITEEGSHPKEEPAPSEAKANGPEESVATEKPENSVPVRRPRFRVGDVPIYEESDFVSELRRELSKCKRVDRPLTLILIRVGDLRQIVELFGKDVREPVLWHVAEQAMESLREVDLVGMMASKDLIAMTAFASDRYGGGRIVSRMRQAVSKKPFRVGDELPPIIPVLDFGMATFPADGGDATVLMQRAERDLADGRFALSD